jgi:hypothetical protein
MNEWPWVKKIINIVSNTYKVTGPNNIGSTSDLIRKCDPSDKEEWKKYCLSYLHNKNGDKIDFDKLSQDLFNKASFHIDCLKKQLSNMSDEQLYQKCFDFIYDLVIDKTFDGYINEKEIITKTLSKKLGVDFQQPSIYQDSAKNIDAIGKKNNVVFYIQLKPASFINNYNTSQILPKQQPNFFVVYYNKNGIVNEDIIKEIEKYINQTNTDPTIIDKNDCVKLTKSQKDQNCKQNLRELVKKLKETA